MKEERGIKELFEVMLNNQKLFTKSLCSWSSRLRVNKQITLEEDIFLYRYIAENRPSKFSSHNAWLHRNYSYYWECGDIKPRIKWIKKHIKKLSK